MGAAVSMGVFGSRKSAARSSVWRAIGSSAYISAFASSPIVTLSIACAVNTGGSLGAWAVAILPIMLPVVAGAIGGDLCAISAIYTRIGLLAASLPAGIWLGVVARSNTLVVVIHIASVHWVVVPISGATVACNTAPIVKVGVMIVVAIDNHYAAFMPVN
jgi:hypothetical protein